MKTSSDDFIDVQIQENLGRETLMSIDSTNQRQDWVSFMGFVLIFVILLVAGYYGPEEYSVKIYERINSETVGFLYKGISPLNRYVHINLNFRFFNGSEVVNEDVMAKCTISLKNKKKGFQVSSNYDGMIPVRSSSNRNASKTIHIFKDEVVNYDSLEGKITFGEINVSHSTIVEVKVGSFDHTMFQIYLRITLSIIQIVFLLSFWLRLNQINYKMWHLEQKITVPLTLITVFYTNPLYFIQAKNPAHVFSLFDIILEGLYDAYFCVYVFLLLDSLRFKNRKTDECFFVPKFLWVIVIFVVSYFKGMINHSKSNYLHIEGDSTSEYYCNLCSTVIYVLFMLNVMYSVIISCVNVDSTERYKCTVYVMTCFMFLIVMLAEFLFFDTFAIIHNSSIPVVFHFAIRNIFALVMTYFHWPYEVLEDQAYIDGTQQVPPSEFFANSDIDQDYQHNT